MHYIDIDLLSEIMPWEKKEYKISAKRKEGDEHFFYHVRGTKTNITKWLREKCNDDGTEAERIQQLRITPQ